jgi:hypothetical protein
LGSGLPGWICGVPVLAAVVFDRDVALEDEADLAVEAAVRLRVVAAIVVLPLEVDEEFGEQLIGEGGADPVHAGSERHLAQRRRWS